MTTATKPRLPKALPKTAPFNETAREVWTLFRAHGRVGTTRPAVAADLCIPQRAVFAAVSQLQAEGYIQPTDQFVSAGGPGRPAQVLVASVPQ